MSKYLTFFVFISAVLSTNVHAVTTTGVLKVVHLNGEVQNRIACVQMEPAVPDVPWACLYNDNPVYKEIYALLLAGYSASKTCVVGWDTVDSSNYKKITLVECK